MNWYDLVEIEEMGRKIQEYTTKAKKIEYYREKVWQKIQEIQEAKTLQEEVELWGEIKQLWGIYESCVSASNALEELIALYQKRKEAILCSFAFLKQEAAPEKSFSKAAV